jgi:Subtilase family
MTSRRTITARASLLLVAFALQAAVAWAALPGGKLKAPTPVSPEANTVATESGLRLAWLPVSGAERQVVVVSRAPFDASSWSRSPGGSDYRVIEVSKPIASLADLGINLDSASDLYWAVGSGTERQMSFSETRRVHVLPKFSNRLAPAAGLIASPVAKMTPRAASEPKRVRLAAGFDIDPKTGVGAALAASRPGETPRTPRNVLVHYGDQDPTRIRESIVASGGQIIAYVPDQTFLVRVAPGRGTIADAGIAWTGEYVADYKLSDRLDRASTSPDVATLLAFPDGDLASIEAAVKSAGGEVVLRSDNGINKILRIRLPGTAVPALAAHDDVQWIEPYVQPVADNVNAQWVVQTGATNNRRLWTLGLNGEGQVFHHSDSGIDLTHELFNDPGVPLVTFGQYPTHRKVIAYENAGTTPDIQFGDHGSWHGSHTSGTTAGRDPILPASAFEGLSHEGKVWHTDLSGAALGNGLAPPADLNDLFQPAYTGNAGGAARLSTNSWGAPVGGAYTIDASNVDRFMWDHPDFLVFFSNGNSGPSGNTVGSPAVAKNCVSVGGTLNGSGQNSMYVSSSRGPTDDARRKPTVVGPASSLTSANSGPAGYAALAGTSMSCPAVTGMAGLLRQYCTEGWYPTGAKVPGNAFTPSAALLKAIVVNSGTNRVSGTIAPDFNVGWGRVAADSALFFVGDVKRLLLVDNTDGLGHGDAIEYQVQVVNDSSHLEVSLVWTDYPASPTSTIQLVNNLDLTVTRGANVFKGNVYTGGFSFPNSGSYDIRNVEECVLVKNAPPGLYTIRIEGVNIPSGPQAFGLCITGGVGTTAGMLALDRADYGSTSTVELKVTDTNGGPSVNVTVGSSTEPGGETVTLTGSNGIYNGTLQLSPVQGSGGDGTLQVSHGDVLTATYLDASPAASLSQTATVSMNGPVITNVGALSGAGGTATIVWNTNINASSRVYYGTTPALGSSSTLDPTSVFAHGTTLTGLVSGTTYYFDVESTDLNGNTTRDDNGGEHYRVSARPPGDLLLVYGDGFDRAVRYDHALNALGWNYDVWNAPLNTNPPLGNLTSGMRSYDAIWWQPDLELYPPIPDQARDSITAYLAGGGRLAVTGHDIVWSNSDPTSPYYTLARQLWTENTLKAQYVADPPTWTSIIGVPGDPISNAYQPAGAPYAEPRAGASGDEINPLSGAVGSWLSGDGTPYNAAVRWESGGPQGSPGSGVWGGMNSRLAGMFFDWTNINTLSVPGNATRTDIMQKTLTWLLGRDKPNVTVTAPNGGEVITTATTNITWTENTDGAGVGSRTIEYSLDGGTSWTLLTAGAGASPYNWDFTGVPNSAQALVRIRVTDNGTPAFTGNDASNAIFSIQRTGGDVLGPAIVAGSVVTNPNPIDNQSAASVSATATDVVRGGSNIAAAEWSHGTNPAPAGTGTAMSGAFGSQTVAISGSLTTGIFPLGTRKIHVRAQDAAGNWGPAATIEVVVNGEPVASTPEHLPGSIELRGAAPNPVLGRTMVTFALPLGSRVKLGIYDVAGRRVKMLFDGDATAGLHSVPWDRTDHAGRIVGPGVYYTRMEVHGKAYMGKIVTLN